MPIQEGQNLRAYDEIIDFIARGSSPESVSEFQASDQTQTRIQDLVTRNANGEITDEERIELAQYVEMEHLMRLAKARSRRHVAPTSTTQ